MSRTPEEYTRAARVLKIVYLLTSFPGRFNRKALAERYDVSERTIQHDLTIIKHALILHLTRETSGYAIRGGFYLYRRSA